jgi:hypothetical protein
MMSAMTALLPRAMAWLGGCLLAGMLAACAAPTPVVPPPPDGARTLPATGAHETRTDLAVADLYARYAPHYGSLHSSSWLLPDAASWPAVEAHYARALRDWGADPRFPPRTGRTASRTWTRDGKVLVVALFDAAGSRVLVVATSLPEPG